MNIAPKEITAIVEWVLRQSELVKQGKSSYIDDILVDERVVKAEAVVQHLSHFGLASKSPVRLCGSLNTRVLRLQVTGSGEWR